MAKRRIATGPVRDPQPRGATAIAETTRNRLLPLVFCAAIIYVHSFFCFHPRRRCFLSTFARLLYRDDILIKPFGPHKHTFISSLSPTLTALIGGGGMGLHTAPAWNTLSNDLRPRTTPPFNELHDAGYYSWLSESSVSQASLSSASEQSVTSMLSVSSRSLSISGGTLVTTVYTTYPDGSSSSSESTTIILPASPSQTPTPTPPTTTLTSTGLSSLHSLSSLTSTSSSSTSSSFLTPTEVPQNVAASSTPMCVGNGMDTQAIGVTTALVLGLGFGLLVWVRNHVLS